MLFPHGHICGCYYTTPAINTWSNPQRHYLPQVDVKAHTTILSTTSRTTLTQKFVVPSKTKGIKKLQYTFPLFDGVSVVGFKCTIGERVIVGEVQGKEQAKKTYEEAVDRGEVAGLLEQLPEASDVFITSVGNVPPNSEVLVDITYLGELKHDAEVDGVRFTIPATVSPRYGDYPGQLPSTEGFSYQAGRFEVVVDAALAEDFFIREMRSPTHPIAVSLGTISTASDAKPSMNKASATLSLSSAELNQDFILQIVSKEFGAPSAVLETHPTIPGSRALMATLVPNFELPQQSPEIVFICDRSGSMAGSNIISLSKALQVFIKSLPIGVVFNVCSFGSDHEFLWPKSRPYNKENMEHATQYVKAFQANFGGTDMMDPVRDTLNNRYSDRSLEVFLVTDGEIWDQQALFDLLDERIQVRKEPVRVFTLGIGDGVSHALIEGVARAGDGFSQSVGDNEKLDAKVVRMLKAALYPHINDYTLEVKYEKNADDDFEIIEKVSSEFESILDLDSSKDSSGARNSSKSQTPVRKVISLFNTSAKLDGPIAQGDMTSIPKAEIPKMLQAPQKLPQLYPFSRNSVYILMSPDTCQRKPMSVVLRGSSGYGPLELEIPVTTLDLPGETIHQLAAKKAVLELEEGRGWLQVAKTVEDRLVKDKHPSYFGEIVRLETVRLGTTFQVGGKNCSFVATEKGNDKDEAATTEDDFEYLDNFDGQVGDIVAVKKNANANIDYASSYGSLATTPPGAGIFRKRSTAFAASTNQVQHQNQPLFYQQKQSQFQPSLRGGMFGSTNPPAPAANPFADSGSGGLFTSANTPFAQNMQAPASIAAGGLFGSSSAAGASDTGTLFGIPRGAATAMRASAPSFGAMPKSASDAAPSPASSYAPASFSAGTKPSPFGTMSFGGPAPAPPPPASAAPAPAPARALTSRRRTVSSESDEASASLSADPLEGLIELQTFEGYWEWSAALLRTMGIDVNKVSSIDNTDTMATVLAVYYIETRMAKDKDSWELIVEKAKTWLAGAVEADRLAALNKIAQNIIV